LTCLPGVVITGEVTASVLCLCLQVLPSFPGVVIVAGSDSKQTFTTLCHKGSLERSAHV
jgi:hypothetical protein